MQEWKMQELKDMESRPCINFWRSKLESGCVWLPTVNSRQLVSSPTELTGLVPGVGVIHFDVESDSESPGLKTPSLYSLVVFKLLFLSSFTDGLSSLCSSRIHRVRSVQAFERCSWAANEYAHQSNYSCYPRYYVNYAHGCQLKELYKENTIRQLCALVR